jgi:hypothetical protein
MLVKTLNIKSQVIAYDGSSADVRGKRETVITKLTVAFRIRVLRTTVILFGYSANQGLNSESLSKFRRGRAVRVAWRVQIKGSVCVELRSYILSYWDHITQ